MTVSTTVRNLRDGSLVINDGASTPLSCAVACDEGDLNWTVAKENIDVYCRQNITGRRQGRNIPCEVSFTLKWQQLIAYTNNSSDAVAPYEILVNYGDSFTSTRSNNDHYAVQLVFTVVDSSGVATNNEIITFDDFFPASVNPGEGEEANTIAVSGSIMNEAPTITRGS